MIPPEFALVAGIALACLAFAAYRGATALTWSFVIGYLVLPSGAAINFQGLPPVDKMRAIWLGATLGTVLFQPRALARIRWHAADALVLAVIVLSACSSIANQLGYWNTQSAAVSVVLTTALPYMLARVHFREAADLAAFGKALFWGAVFYVPLAVWEFRMSPQFNNAVYGYFPHSWAQHRRWGFYRPIVFLSHGVSVAALFGGSLLIGLVLLRGGLLRRSAPVPVHLAFFLLGLGLLLSMSTGPWLAVPLGWAVFKAAKRRWWAPVAAGVPGVIWVVTVFATASSWGWLTRPLEAIGATERAASLQYRLDAMTEYSENIIQRPWLGHGGWGRGRIKHRATDSPALIHMLKNGLLGASVWYAWQFWIVFAACRVAAHCRHTGEGEVIRLYASLMGIVITFYIFGFAASFVPIALVGGAVTGLAPVSSRAKVVAGHEPRLAY